MGDKVTLMILTLGVISMKLAKAQPHTVGNKWTRPTVVTHDYHDLLMGIDQRVRHLDTIRHLVSRTDITIQSLLNRLDLIDNRIQSVQNSFKNAFEAMSATVKSTEIKYELLFEQFSQKLDVGIDRINHKVNSIESHNEAALNKIQNKLDLNFGRLVNKQTSYQNDIMRLNSNIDFIRTQTTYSEERANQTFKILINHLQDIRIEQAVKKEHLRNITNLVTEIHGNRSDGYVLSDAPNLPEESIKIIRSEINGEGNKIGTKMSNMYNEMWDTVKDLERTIRNGFEDSNKTNINLYKKITDMIQEERITSESFLDVVIRSSLSIVSDRVKDLQRINDNEFKVIKASQDFYGEICHETKSLIENNIALVLGKIYDSFLNRTSKFSKQIHEVGELVKDHNRQLIQTTSKINNFLGTVAEESGHEHKQLDNSITEVADSLQDFQMDVHEINDKHEASLKEFKSLLLASIKAKTNTTNSYNNNLLHAIDANYSNGVISIKTNPTHTDSKETNNEPDNRKTRIPFETLNKTISTKDFVAIIGESRKRIHKNNEDEINTKRGNEKKDDIEVHEQTTLEEGKPVDSTQFLLAYVKFLHGHLTPQEFLTEAVPGNSYRNFDDMVSHLQKADNVPRETIQEIQQLAQQQTYRESIQVESDVGRLLKKLHQSRDMEDEDENYDEEHDEDMI